MPRYYCDYCDTYLTHDSPSVRKQHNSGYKHKANVRTYYQQFEEQQSQSLLDQRIKEHLGQTGAYPQVGVAYNQLRPHFPVLPHPVLPIAGNTHIPVNSPLPIGFRPPVLPRPPTGTQGYVSAPVMPPMVGPPGAPPSYPSQVNGLPRPPTVNPPTMVPGSTSVVTPAVYQTSPPVPTSGSFDSFNVNAEPIEANH
ncbi:U1 small nuclear ribonucleoprotein C-like isoform X2 [Cornus florida]|nr:U1 small nuclear ribonucleoprotein C-like isoform X2 [Cornus florida]XP_059656883.1 U1 small nuclear ribonucleoprotein C-like isoform X2 [Cornus florida]XP_059656884.1 U1 small nuclear ribonucleoprotein C-like isoform X2 [Cornus florida]XP_059656885.1 U1 small nuclear ribonucleoprotein C-like isoform X2 [Cornus florida]XP_059656887.1 U1 small nuclear ribonucleoprotein C-like isoform X2 [Cornus florida]